MTPPYVIKTDGLAAGKGVLVTRDLEEAAKDVREKLSGRAFGGAGQTVVIEEGLDGPECSLMVLCDGTNVAPLVPSQDFKRLGDGDAGANTGGMGAYAPMTSLSPAELDEIMESIVAPTVRELERRDIDYRGVLYAGVMLTSNGPKILEYNARFGDPETEAMVPLYGDSFFDLLLQVGEGRLAFPSPVASGAAVTVILASHGYPQSPRKGDVISGLGMRRTTRAGRRRRHDLSRRYRARRERPLRHGRRTSARGDRRRRDARTGSSSRLRGRGARNL